VSTRTQRAFTSTRSTIIFHTSISTTQDEELSQEEEDQVQDNEPPQEEDIDQGGDEVDQEKEDEQDIQDKIPSHPRVHQAIQRDHHVNSIGDIQKGVTTRS
jgi:hypothetical protein